MRTARSRVYCPGIIATTTRSSVISGIRCCGFKSPEQQKHAIGNTLIMTLLCTAQLLANDRATLRSL